MKYGHQYGLVPGPVWARLQAKEHSIREAAEVLESGRYDEQPLVRLLRRPGTTFSDLEALSPELTRKGLPADVKEQVEIELKYEGYIRRQEGHVLKMRQLEDKQIPEDIDYRAIEGFSNEARRLLDHLRPVTVGQATRIAGVRPADISVLMVYLKGDRPVPRRPAAPQSSPPL